MRFAPQKWPTGNKLNSVANKVRRLMWLRSFASNATPACLSVKHAHWLARRLGLTFESSGENFFADGLETFFGKKA
jgi:hypothetical protein